ncbi:MAG: hypothetical protein R3F02_12310 [Thiolinea sp.]
MKKEILSQGKIGKIYKDAIAPVLYKYDEMSVIRITIDYHLLSDGHVKEVVDLTFRYNGSDTLEAFPWHVTCISSNTKVLGVRIKPNRQINGLKSTRLKNIQLLEIKLNKTQKGDVVHLLFEYFITGASTFTKGLFFNTIHYPIAFIPANTVESIDLRVHLPENATPESDINLTEFFPVKIDGKKILLTSQEGNIVGDVNGNIILKYRNSLYEIFTSVAIGIIFSSILVFVPELKQIFGSLVYILIFLLISFISFIFYNLIK